MDHLFKSAGLDPDEIAGKGFAITRKGFDQKQVRAYLHMLAELIRTLEAQEAAQSANAKSAERETVRALPKQAEDVVVAAQVQADELLAEARKQAAAEVDAGKRQGQEILEEAKRLRLKVLRDMARRRQAAAAQVERLRVGRDKLLAALNEARVTVEQSSEEVQLSLAGAQSAGDAAARRFMDKPEPSDAELVAELDNARLVGMIPEAAPEDLPEAEAVPALEEPSEVAAEPEAETEPEEPPEAVTEPESSEPEPAPEPEMSAPERAPEPEPEMSAPEPETPPEPESEMSEPATEGDRDSLDDIFSRLRAQQEESVEQAKEVLDQRESPTAG